MEPSTPDHDQKQILEDPQSHVNRGTDAEATEGTNDAGCCEHAITAKHRRQLLTSDTEGLPVIYIMVVLHPSCSSTRSY